MLRACIRRKALLRTATHISQPPTTHSNNTGTGVLATTPTPTVAQGPGTPPPYLQGAATRICVRVPCAPACDHCPAALRHRRARAITTHRRSHLAKLATHLRPLACPLGHRFGASSSAEAHRHAHPHSRYELRRLRADRRTRRLGGRQAGAALSCPWSLSCAIDCDACARARGRLPRVARAPPPQQR